jgi:hypothetical protein
MNFTASLCMSRADRAVLHDLGEHIGALHGRVSTAQQAEVDALHREFEVLHDDFEALHYQDMHHALDRRAHDSWRARVKRLTERVDGLIGGANTK